MKTIIIFAIPFFAVIFLISASFTFNKREAAVTPNYDIAKSDINLERVRLAALYKSATTEEAKKKILSAAQPK